MNEARLEELKKILNERHQNLEQGLREDFNAQNFDASKFDNSNASNFDASDLNNTNSKALNSNDKNSDDLNLNAKRDRKFQNSDFDDAAYNKNSKAQIRDYDKDPIIIKSYEKFFQLALPIFSIYFTASLIIGIDILLSQDHDKNKVIMLVSFIFLLFCFIAILYKFYISNSNSIVCLKNNKIEFYDNSKLKRISAYCYLKKDICKEMWGFGLGITKINIEIKISFLLLFLLFLCWFFISEDKIYILLVFPFIFLGNLLLKIIICFVLESKNRRFSPFAGIAIDKMYFLEIKHLPEVFHIHQFGLYCMIYIFNNLEYDQIKEYFLITKDINIDKIQKKYFL